jgi:hypothetical protein
MLEILDADEESNLDDANSPKSPPPSSHNLRSPRNIRSTTNTNERLPIQVPAANKWYTPKAGVWENMKESRQRILTHVQNIEGSLGKLRNPPCALCEKHGHECRVYKENSGPHFGGACSRCRWGSRSCGKVCANSTLLFCQLTRI